MFLNNAGKVLIDTAAADALKATQSLQDLNSTMDAVETNTKVLNEDISSTYSNLEAVKDISNTMTVSVQEVVVGITNQAESIDQVYNMINTADETALETQRTSVKLKEISSQASHLVANGSDKIKQMNQQMDIISQAVTESVDTVRELQDNMAEINEFLSGIVSISSQTNLLALNASNATLLGIVKAPKNKDVIFHFFIVIPPVLYG
jgi:methyl-accepting chemotaxis protein